MAGNTFDADEIDLSTILSTGQKANLDDFVLCRIFCDPPSESALVAKLAEIVSRLEEFCRVYAWTCCPLVFRLMKSGSDARHPLMRPIPMSADSVPAHIAACHRVGDNLEEEWLCVHLLMQLSMEMHDISVTIHDADGQFLLIEAAYHIPSWLSPATARNRVWIRRGTFHIIPLQYPERPSASITNTAAVPPLSIPVALDVLRSSGGGTLAKPAFQKCLTRRLAPFSEVVQRWTQPTRPPRTASRDAAFSREQHQLSAGTLCFPHRCRIVVPVPIARILSRFPHLIGVALDHLPPSLDTLRQMKQRRRQPEAPPPERAPESVFPQRPVPVFDCLGEETRTVCVPVVMNRCQAGRLKQLQLRCPPPFAFADWKFPHAAASIGNHEGLSQAQIRLRSAMDRGAKLCLGLFACFTSHQQSSTLDGFFWSSGTTESRNRSAECCGQQHIAEFLSLIQNARLQDSPPLKNMSGLADLLPYSSDFLGAYSADAYSAGFQQVFRDVYADAEKPTTCVLGQHGDADEKPPSEESGSSDPHDAADDARLQSCYGTADGGVASDDECWLEVQPGEVQRLIDERRREERFRDALRNCISPSGDKVARNDNADNSDSDAWGEGISEAKRLDREFKQMVDKFRLLLNKESGVEGIEASSCSSAAQLGNDFRERLKKSIPEDVLDLLDDWEISSAADDDFESSAISSDASECIDATSYQSKGSLVESSEEEMISLMDRMDKELAEVKTHNTRRDPRHLGRSSVDLGEVDPALSFRPTPPMSLSATELLSTVAEDLSTSRRLEDSGLPGPASLLLGSLSL